MHVEVAEYVKSDVRPKEITTEIQHHNSPTDHIFDSTLIDFVLHFRNYNPNYSEWPIKGSQEWNKHLKLNYNPIIMKRKPSSKFFSNLEKAQLEQKLKRQKTDDSQE